VVEPRLRPAARGIVVDDADRVLLCRFDFPNNGVTVWTAPGGGVEPGETPLGALRRELAEEVGLALDGDPPHVWHQRVVADGHATGYDGVINDFYLIRTAHFVPRGSMSADDLRAENVTDFRWWHLAEIRTYQGDAVFAPRDLGRLLDQLLRAGVPTQPLRLGL
jgi:8-oxo-dGTP diphosphatase